MSLLEINQLSVEYHTARGVAPALRNISFTVDQGEKIGIIGESGSGKSTLANAILGMLPRASTMNAGSIRLSGKSVSEFSSEEWRATRGARIGFIPQGALNSLNPVLSVEKQIADTIKDHGILLSRSSLRQKISGLLESVGLGHEIAKAYPCQLSGGMKQRVCIALGIVLTPKIVVADEPTSALDVINQKQIMMTLDRIQRESGLSVMLIGHDLGLLAQFVDRIMVLYAGQIVELCSVRDFLENPLHPYSKALIASLPTFENRNFSGIAGLAPSLFDLPEGCVFYSRCTERRAHCSQQEPALQTYDDGRSVSCHLCMAMK